MIAAGPEVSTVTGNQPGTTTEPEHGEIPALLVRYLASRDVPCPRCHYNLRAAPSPRCPECGATIEPRITSDRIRMGPWIFGLVSICLPLGLSVFVAAMALADLLYYRLSPAQDRTILLVNSAACGAATVLVCVWIRSRRRLWLLERQSQRLWALAMLAIGVLGLIALFYAMYYL